MDHLSIPYRKVNLSAWSVCVGDGIYLFPKLDGTKIWGKSFPLFIHVIMRSPSWKYRKNFIVLFQSLASNLVLKRGSLTWRKRWIWKHLSRFHFSNCSTFLLRHCWETIKTKAWINGPRVGTKSQLLLYFIFGRNVRAWLRNQSEFY